MRVRMAAAIGLLLLGVSAASSAASSAPQTLVDLIRAGNREAVLAAITSPDIDVNAARARWLYGAAVGDLQRSIMSWCGRC